MRSEFICIISLGLTLAVIGNAWVQRQQFYPSVVYITKSNPSMAVIYLQSLVVVVLLGKVMRKIFFGQLRAAEFEHLMERSWYAVTETCLAFTVFKDDFSPKFVSLFVLLLFLKSFHWLAEDRVDFMERSPAITVLFHIRVLSLSVFLAALDIMFIQHACNSTITKGASVQLVFGFEYAVLLTIILNTLVKYVLHSVDLHSDTIWENKAVFMLYTELFIGFIKVLLYVLFFMIMVRIFTLPLFAVRPMYLTMRAFKKAFNDVVLSRRAIHNMNTLYPNATAEELESTDNVCIICREEMTAPTAKKLPCNHIFHRSCLRSWFQRQQTCPTCRLDVLRSTPAATAAPQPAAANFQQQVAALRQQLEALQQQRHQQQHQNLPNLLNFMGLPPQGNVLFPPAAAAAAGGAAAQGGAAASSTSGTSTTSTFTAAGAGASGLPGTSTAPTGTGRPPLLLPPFPPFMAFNVPPPLPPPNFQGMSEAELLEMEGNERKHVEARIRCLRNVQVLLDAAVLEMQQYSAVVARCTAQQNLQRSTTVSTSQSSNTSTASSVTASATTTTTTTSVDSSVNKTQESPVTNQVTAGAAAAPTLTDTNAPVGQSAGSPSSPAAPAVNTRADEADYTSTGARPKVTQATVVTSTVKVSSTGSLDDTKDISTEDNPFSQLPNTVEQDEIRRRRLAVFEEQKNRLMKKKA